jgi:hypothetical protein
MEAARLSCGMQKVPSGTGLEISEVGEAEGGAEVLAEFEPMFFGDGHENLDDFGVELGARAAADLLAGVRERQSLTIGAVADHGVQGIGDGENAGPERDPVAL